jgi:hypothetical protein
MPNRQQLLLRERNRTGPSGAFGAGAAGRAKRNGSDAGQHPWRRHRNGGYVGTGGSKRREKGLAKSGNARVRRGLIQLAWRFLLFQKDSALAQWFRSRTDGVKGARKTKMIVALARKLLIALWRMVTTGEVPHGVVVPQAV